MFFFSLCINKVKQNFSCHLFKKTSIFYVNIKLRAAAGFFYFSLFWRWCLVLDKANSHEGSTKGVNFFAGTGSYRGLISSTLDLNKWLPSVSHVSRFATVFGCQWVERWSDTIDAEGPDAGGYWETPGSEDLGIESWCRQGFLLRGNRYYKMF